MQRFPFSTLLISASFSLFTLPALATEAEVPSPSPSEDVVELQLEVPSDPSFEQQDSDAMSDSTSSEQRPTTHSETAPASILNTPSPTSNTSETTNAELTPHAETVNDEVTESIPPEMVSPNDEQLSEPLTENISVVSQNTALVLSFPNDTQVTIQKDGLSILAIPLAHPLIDRMGQTAIPAGSIVQLQFVSTGDEIQMSATDLVISGQVVPIQSSSVPLGSVSLSNAPRALITRPANRLWGLGRLGRYTTPPFTDNTSTVWNHAISATAELMFERTYTGRTHMVNIPAQSTFVLTLQEDIVLLGH